METAPDDLYAVVTGLVCSAVYAFAELKRRSSSGVPQDKQKIKKNEQKSDAPGVYGEVYRRIQPLEDAAASRGLALLLSPAPSVCCSPHTVHNSPQIDAHQRISAILPAYCDVKLPCSGLAGGPLLYYTPVRHHSTVSVTSLSPAGGLQTETPMASSNNLVPLEAKIHRYSPISSCSSSRRSSISGNAGSGSAMGPTVGANGEGSSPGRPNLAGLFATLMTNIIFVSSGSDTDGGSSWRGCGNSPGAPSLRGSPGQPQRCGAGLTPPRGITPLGHTPASRRCTAGSGAQDEGGDHGEGEEACWPAVPRGFDACRARSNLSYGMERRQSDSGDEQQAESGSCGHCNCRPDGPALAAGGRESDSGSPAYRTASCPLAGAQSGCSSEGCSRAGARAGDPGPRRGSRSHDGMRRSSSGTGPECGGVLLVGDYRPRSSRQLLELQGGYGDRAPQCSGGGMGAGSGPGCGLAQGVRGVASSAALSSLAGPDGEEGLRSCSSSSLDSSSSRGSSRGSSAGGSSGRTTGGGCTAYSSPAGPLGGGAQPDLHQGGLRQGSQEDCGSTAASCGNNNGGAQSSSGTGQGPEGLRIEPSTAAAAPLVSPSAGLSPRALHLPLPPATPVPDDFLLQASPAPAATPVDPPCTPQRLDPLDSTQLPTDLPPLTSSPQSPVAPKSFHSRTANRPRPKASPSPSPSLASASASAVCRSVDRPSWASSARGPPSTTPPHAQHPRPRPLLRPGTPPAPGAATPRDSVVSRPGNIPAAPAHTPSAPTRYSPAAGTTPLSFRGAARSGPLPSSPVTPLTEPSRAGALAHAGVSSSSTSSACRSTPRSDTMWASGAIGNSRQGLRCREAQQLAGAGSAGSPLSASAGGSPSPSYLRPTAASMARASPLGAGSTPPCSAKRQQQQRQQQQDSSPGLVLHTRMSITSVG